MAKNPKKNWIKLNRAIMDDWIWTKGNDEPFDKRSAWIDLLMLAYAQDDTRMHNGEMRTIKRGQVPYSKEWLANRWKWSRGKVNRFLRSLERDNKCTTDSTTHGTIITIEKYAFWQGGRSTDGTTNDTTDDTTDGTTDGQPTERPTDTVKNIYRIYKNKENIYIPADSAEVKAYCIERGNNIDPEYFFDYYQGRGWMSGKDPITDWKAIVRLWEKRDKSKRGTRLEEEVNEFYSMMGEWAEEA